jgi:hypothetical protein
MLEKGLEMTTANPRKRTKRSWLSRIDDWFWQQTQRDREAYLGQSVDLCDFERRLKALERGQWL